MFFSENFFPENEKTTSPTKKQIKSDDANTLEDKISLNNFQFDNIYSWLSRLIAARGCSTRY